jgi:hypothetical protein
MHPGEGARAVAKGGAAAMVSPDKNIKDVKIEGDGTDVFVVYAGVKIAKRGHPGTPQAGTWISLEPGWTALDCKDESAIEISYKSVLVH